MTDDCDRTRQTKQSKTTRRVWATSSHTSSPTQREAFSVIHRIFVMASDKSDAPAGIPSITDPSAPLIESYTYHSPVPTSAGPYILGVDEAGRGPVLGPLVYGVAYCPVAYKESLEELGFAGTLTYCSIFPTVTFNHHRLQDTHRAGALFPSGHIVLRSCKPGVVRPCPEVSMSSGVCVSLTLKPLPNSPKNISAGMLRRPPTNLNQQSQNATVLLIREVLARGIQLSEVRPRQSPCT